MGTLMPPGKDMKLYVSGNSPYARRARIAIREGGLTDQVEEIAITSFEELKEIGPGGKIPILVTRPGESLCESLIITRFLNELSGGVLLPESQEAKLKCLELESTASVLMDSMFVRSMEKNQREEALKSSALLKRESGRCNRCYDTLDERVDENDDAVTLGSIAVISALGYANWRHPEDEWRSGRPRLTAYYDKLMARKAFEETAPVY
jgi:glutathione S-transferase